MLLEDLQAFAAVVECASVTKAAERLRLTQSAVSRRIQNLEQSLGAVLLLRTQRPPIPTLMALRIYDEALGLLHAAERLRRIPEETALPTGRFRVGFTQVVADIAVVNVVTAIKLAFPALDMQVITHWSSELEKLLTAGNLDIATLLLMAPSKLPSGFVGSLIESLDVLVVQSKNRPSIGPTSISELSQFDWILNPKGCGYRAALESAMGGHGTILKLAVDTHDAAIQMRMVAAGLGLGLLPRRILESSSLKDELSVVEVSDFSLRMESWVVSPLHPGNLKQANELLEQKIVEGFQSFRHGESL